MWTLMSDGEATEAIGVVADIRRESKFQLRLVEVISSIKDANLLILMYPTREHMAEWLLVEIVKLLRDPLNLESLKIFVEDNVLGEGEYTIPTSTVFGLSKSQ